MKKALVKQVIIGSMALALIGGGGALAISQNAFAATATPAPTAAAAAPDTSGHALKGPRGISDELLAFLKLDKAAFETKLETETLAKIATDQGISRDALKAELTKEFNAKLEKEKTDFAANLDTSIDSQHVKGLGGPGGGKGGPGGKGGHDGIGGFGGPGGAKADLTATATLLGYATVDELKAALVPGTSIADLATAKGITVQSVIDLQVAQIVKDLDAKLAAKTITQAQYDAKKADSIKAATNLVNDEHDRKGGGGKRGGFGHQGGAAAPLATPSVSTSSATVEG